MLRIGIFYDKEYTVEPCWSDHPLRRTPDRYGGGGYRESRTPDRMGSSGWRDTDDVDTMIADLKKKTTGRYDWFCGL